MYHVFTIKLKSDFEGAGVGGGGGGGGRRKTVYVTDLIPICYTQLLKTINSKSKIHELCMPSL